MKIIYKYTPKQVILPFDIWHVEATEGAVPLTLQLQRGMPALWLELDPGAKPKTYCFMFVATGEGFPNGGKYVGTIQYPDSGLVFHLYQI